MDKLKFVLVLSATGLFFYFLTPSADRDESGQIVTEGNVDVFSIQLGDCFNDTRSYDSEDVEVLNVDGMPCDLPHDNEVYAITNMTMSAYPGDEILTEAANDYCFAQFEIFAGIAYEASVLNITFLYPTQESWNQARDREVACVVYDMNGEKITGSSRGKGI